MESGRFDLTGKNALLTGASSGIGRELALSYAYDGHRVAVAARSAGKLSELEALSSNITAFPVDVTDTGAVPNRDHLAND